MPNLPLSWSSQLFDMRAPLSTEVHVLLLNQPIVLVAPLKLRQIFLKPRRVNAVQFTTLTNTIQKSFFKGDINPIPFMIIFARCRKKLRDDKRIKI